MPIWLWNGCRVKNGFMLKPGSHVYSRFGCRVNIHFDIWTPGVGLAQWLGGRILDEGVPGSSPGRAPFVVALNKSQFPLLSTGQTQEAVDGRPTWPDCDEAGDYVVPNVLSPRNLVSRPDNMDDTVLHTYMESHPAAVYIFSIR